ncbi:MAG: PH domain-containing protein [Actinomycetaceae bacterium]|nr:PH domain-containing protein [Arcanobacterium sp.]MDD7687001.1 PH domain-containing protein [Actinomycetaceae bacterium]MDY5273343.1 PH domain-containing protein [Arcanobacterium sp.]
MKIILGNDLPLKRVAPDYVKVALISTAIIWGVVVAVLLVVSCVVTFATDSLVWRIIVWAVTAAMLIGAIVDAFLTPRRVRAIGYAELPEELVIRAGLLFQKLVLVPYGRMQQVNVETGPLLSRFGLAKIELVTASATTNASIEGLPLAEAERLREKLMELGGAHMEGI